MAQLMKKPGKVSGSAEVKGFNRKDSTELTDARDTDGTSVTACVGLVLSENYQSVKVEATVTLPTTYAERESAMDEAWAFVDDQVAAKLASAKKLMNSL
jgi:hypothetical protein